MSVFQTTLFSNKEIEELLGYLMKMYQQNALAHLSARDNPHHTTTTQAATAEAES